MVKLQQGHWFVQFQSGDSTAGTALRASQHHMLSAAIDPKARSNLSRTRRLLLATYFATFLFT
jgi:hypothetical protein